MDYKDVLANAKKNIGPGCKVCPECNGLALRQSHARSGLEGARQRCE